MNFVRVENAIKMSIKSISFIAMMIAIVANNALAQNNKWKVGQYIVERSQVAADLPDLQGVQNLGFGTQVVEHSPSPFAPQADSYSGEAEYVAELDNYCAELMLSDSSVTACSPNYIVQASATPNDASLNSLWGMIGTNGIGASAGWDLSTGSASVVVSIIDTGADYNHSDLAANIWTNPNEIPGNGVDDDNDGYVDDVHGINAATGSGNPMDDNGHGTHVAGTIGAIGNNGVGVVGVNWNVKIMPLKFLNSQGSGSLADAIKAINYMIDQKQRGVNIRVVNNSWGGGGFSQSLYNAIDRAYKAGIIFTAAAGNEANDNDASPSYPSSYDLPNVVSVAAIDQNGNIASFSNYGVQQVDIAAPGVGILSTTPGNHYGTLSGTSMATPHVTGALALLFGYDNSISMADAIARLYDSAREKSSLSGLIRTGRTLDVGRLLNNTVSPLPSPTPSPICNYAMKKVNVSPDSSADSVTPVLQSDELNYYKLDLPFSFPFHGESIQTIYISPNGVVYTKSAPVGMDYQNGKTAPSNSIAVLHSDLYPIGSNNGVKVAVASDRVTINWTAPLYIMRSSKAIARLTIYSNGVINQWLSFSDKTIESYIKTHATVGLKGGSSSSAFTYSASDGKIKNGLAIEYTPQCGSSNGSSHINQANLTGRSKSGSPINRIIAGGKLNLLAMGTGNGSVSVAFKIDGRSCQSTKTMNFVQGAGSMTGTFPRIDVKSVQAYATGEDGITVSSSLKVQNYTAKRLKKITSKRLSASALASACNSLMGSLAE